MDSLPDNVKTFFKIIQEDLSVYRPQTSLNEVNKLLATGLSVLNNNKNEVNKAIESEFSFSCIDELKTFISANIVLNKKGFLWRPLYSGAPIHHVIPSDYDIFTEVSGDIYENYMYTLNALSSKHFDKNDLEKCLQFLYNHDYILVWSNTAIIVDNLLSENENELKEKNITIYGGTTLVAHKDNLFILNIYHEDDWILGFVKNIYNIDLLKELKRNVIYDLFINKKSYKIVIISEDLFHDKNVLPHRQYNHFLL